MSDISDNFDKAFQRAMAYAHKISIEKKIREITPEVFAVAILSSGQNTAVSVMSVIKVNIPKIIEKLHGVAAGRKDTDVKEGKEVKVGFNYGYLKVSDETSRIIQGAVRVKNRMGNQIVGVQHMLLSLLANNKDIEMAFASEGVNHISLQEAMKDLVKQGSPDYKEQEAVASSNPSAQTKTVPNVPAKNKGGKEPAKKGPASESLEKFCTDLTMEAAMGRLDPVVGRTREIARLASILCRKRKNNPVLVGDAGTGKTAICEGLAHKIVMDDVPAKLKGKRLYRLNLSSLVSNTQFRGQFEERMKGLVQTFKDNSECILFIDEIHTIVGAGNTSGSLDASNILKPALARGELRCIGATTLDEYGKYIAKDAALERRFQPVLVDENTRDEAVQILYGLRQSFENHHGCKISDDAVVAAVDLSIRYIPDRRIPDKAIDCLDEACAMRMSTLQNQAKDTKGDLPLIAKDDIILAVAEQGRIPVKNIAVSEYEKVSKIGDILKSKIIGQDRSVDRIQTLVCNAYSGFRDMDKPMMSFVVGGPTHVGKTLTIEELAKEICPIPDSLITINMSEFQEKHEISKLIGSPPGYVGYGEKNMFSDRVYRRPNSVVFFDEMEKGHPDVIKIVLQILGKGFINDGEGKKISFKNTVVVMSTNIGMDVKNIGFGSEARDSVQDFENARTALVESCKKFMGIELVSRIDDFIPYLPMTEESYEKIAKAELAKLGSRIKEAKGVSFSFTGKAVDLMLDLRKKSHAQNAAGILDVVRKHIQPVISAQTGKMASGDNTLLKLDVDGGKFTVKAMKRTA